MITYLTGKPTGGFLRSGLARGGRWVVADEAEGSGTSPGMHPGGAVFNPVVKAFRTLAFWMSSETHARESYKAAMPELGAQWPMVSSFSESKSNWRPAVG